MRRLTLIVPFLVALAIAPSCTHTTPQTPAQIAYQVKTVGAQIEASLVAVGNAATTVRDVVHGLPISADQRATFDTKFAELQRAADTAIDQVKAFSTGSAPVLGGVHGALQTVANLWAPFAALVKSVSTNANLASTLDLATTAINTALVLTAPTGGQ
jgi:hypothetical protein